MPSSEGRGPRAPRCFTLFIPAPARVTPRNARATAVGPGAASGYALAWPLRAPDTPRPGSALAPVRFFSSFISPHAFLPACCHQTPRTWSLSSRHVRPGRNRSLVRCTLEPPDTVNRPASLGCRIHMPYRARPFADPRTGQGNHSPHRAFAILTRPRHRAGLRPRYWTLRTHTTE